MAQHTAPVRHFVFHRHSNTLTTEASDLEFLWNLNGRGLPREFAVAGQRQTVLYQHSPAQTVYDAGREDVVAQVFTPVGVGGLPEIHVLND